MSYYSCKSATGCVDARIPARASYVNLYKWPHSDAEFMKSVTRRRGGHSFNNRACSGAEVVDSYSCRQLYLRSYTFSKKKESVPAKTMRCIGKVKEKAAISPLFIPQNKNNIESNDHKSNKKKEEEEEEEEEEERKKEKKICVRVKKLREASYSAMCSFFRRLLSCSASVDVADRSPA